MRCRLKDLLVYAEWETAELITFVEGLEGAAPGESDKVTRLELAALVVKVRPHGTPSGRAKCPITSCGCSVQRRNKLAKTFVQNGGLAAIVRAV